MCEIFRSHLCQPKKETLKSITKYASQEEFAYLALRLRWLSGWFSGDESSPASLFAMLFLSDFCLTSLAS